MGSDAEDLQAAAAGDVQALKGLVGRWKRPVYSIFERTREPQLAAEAAISIFAEVPARAAQLAEPPGFPEALYALVWERLSAEPEISHARLAEARRVGDSTGSRAEYLRAAVAALPAAERALFLFTRIASLPLETSARIVGLPLDEARATLAAALDQLRATLGPLVDIPSTVGSGTLSRKGPAA